MAAPLRVLANTAIFSVCCAAATLLAGASLSANRERTCSLQESLGASMCVQPAPGSAAESDTLRARVARNPGDANSLAAFALGDRSPRRAGMLAVALQLAPRDPNLLLQRASVAFQRHDWTAAVAPLIELADRRDVPLAAQSLAYLVGIGEGDLLAPYLTRGSAWLPRVLVQLRASGAPVSTALPLTLRASQLGVIDEDAVRAYMRELKAAGAWGDAYALWLSLHGRSQPILYNGSFDQPFEPDGFDWEVDTSAPARRAGVFAARRRSDERGGVLELKFTGRAIAVPIVRQYVFIAPGRYRVRGEYVSRQFQSEGGLMWSLRCEKGMAGQSQPLRDTAGEWRGFDFELDVSPGCGLVGSLQLEPATDSGATLGARGTMTFNALTLERRGP